MKNCGKRVLSVVLCAVLLICALPAMTASAAIKEGESGELLFTSFADLQQLCADTYPDLVTCVYAGEGELVITEDIAIPQTLAVAVDGPVTVAKDAELIVNGQLAAETITVNGMITSYGVVSVLADLYINGAVNNGGFIYMYAGADSTLTNTHWLYHTSEESGVIYMCSFENGQDIQKIAAAANTAPDSHYAYGVYAAVEQVSLDSWVTLPANCVLVVIEPLTLTGSTNAGLVLDGNAQIGAPMTVQCGLRVGQTGYLSVSAPIRVEGSLENMAVIDIFYDDGGSLTLADPKNYIDHYEDYSSVIFVNSQGKQLPQDAVAGLDTANFQISEMDDTYGHYWMLYDYQMPVSGKPLWGDVNGDGMVGSYDATLILQYDVGMIGEAGLVLANMDVSGDGMIGSYDATLILQYDVGMITAFPVES